MLNAFPPEARVRRKAQFQRIFAKRQRLFGHFCILYYRRNTKQCPRLGVVVSKRNVRKAVARSRFKRLVREAFRTQQRNLPALDVVIIAKSGAGNKTKHELQQCLNELLQQLITRCE